MAHNAECGGANQHQGVLQADIGAGAEITHRTEQQHSSRPVQQVKAGPCEERLVLVSDDPGEEGGLCEQRRDDQEPVLDPRVERGYPRHHQALSHERVGQVCPAHAQCLSAPRHQVGGNGGSQQHPAAAFRLVDVERK